MPKLDLSFDPPETKDSGGLGSFGWGGGSNWNTGSSWNFSGVDPGPTNIADSFSMATKESMADTTGSNAWSFGGNKKNQKKTTTSGFDFGIGEEDEGEEEDKIGGNGDWANFTAGGKKDKKSKKGNLDNASDDPNLDTIGTALTDPEPAAGNAWPAWGTTPFNKKKGKKGEDMAPPPPPAAAVHTPAEPVNDEWGGFGTKKGGKKGKKITEVDEPAVTFVPEPEPEAENGWSSTFGKKEKKKGKKEPEKVEDPPVTTVPEPKPEADAVWGSFGKKEKKKGGKKEADKSEEPATTVLEEPEPEPNFGYSAWNTNDDKKGKKGKKDLEKIEDPTITTFPDTGPDIDFGFGLGGKKDDRKGKKGKKDDKIGDPAIVMVPELEPEADIGWGSFSKKKGNKDNEKTEEPSAKGPDPEPVDEWGSLGRKAKDKEKDKKKSKKSSLWDDPKEEQDQDVEETLEPGIDTPWGAFEPRKDKKKGKKDAVEEAKSELEPMVEDKPSLARTGSTKGKKGKKSLVSEIQEDPVPSIESKFGTDAAIVVADDDWASGFGSDKKKDKRNKWNSLASAGSKVDEVSPAPPPVPDVPDVSSFGVWNTDKKDKDKKGKKGKIAEPDFIPVLEPEQKKDVVEDDISSWAGLSVKEKKKKEREKERERKDREAKEAKEKSEAEERERMEREEAEERERMEREEAEERERIEREEAEEREKEEKEKKEKDKSKGKIGKKGKTNTAPETSRTKDLLADSTPDVIPVTEEDRWGPTWGAGASKKKGGKKDLPWMAPPPAPTPPFQDLTPEAEEYLEEDALEDDWGDVAAAKSTTKGKYDAKKDGKEETKAGKKGAKDKVEDKLDENSKKSTKDELRKKDAPKEDTPAKAAKNFWGGMGTTATSKSKTSAKDKEKAAREEEEKGDDLDGDDEIMAMLDEEFPTKNPVQEGNLWKTSTKDSDKASKGSSVGKKKGITDDVADAVMTKGKNGKSKENNNNEAKVDVDVGIDAATTFDNSYSWGSGLKKTAGKKDGKEKVDEVLVIDKKEIGAKNPTNQKLTGKKGVSNEPETTTPSEKDDQPSNLQPSKSLKSAMSTSKAAKTTSSSVLQRVKEIEKEKNNNNNNKPSESAPPVLEPEPTSKFDKKAGATSKTKDVASSKTPPSKTKDFSPEAKTKKKNAKEEAVPGSFPGEGMDDDFNNLDELLDDEPILEKKTSKKSVKSVKDSKVTPNTRNTPESKRPPTPPPEPKEEKPAKKERPRIAKEGASSSWGLWGAAPPKKKETKSKDDTDVPLPLKKEKAAAPGFSRSKSTRTAKEKDKETVKSDPKSSDSEKPKKTESRPPKSRGSSFGALFGGGPPPRTKSVRKNSSAASVPKSAASRRQSVDVDATGLPSPPAEEAPEMTSKAAKMMGTAKLDRKASTRGKQKMPGEKLPDMSKKPLETADGCNVAAPDPYAIDSDDMVMVNDLDDPLVNGKKSSASKDKGLKSKSKGMDAEPTSSMKRDLPDRTKSKRDSRMEPGSSKRKSKIGNDFDDDVVMVDAGSSGDANVEPGPDDMQFITKPKGLQRSATTSKKPESKSSGLGGGLFGAFRKNRRVSEVNERPKSRAVVEDEEVAPRKRTVSGGDDSAKRPRRDDRRKSEKTDRAAEGYVYDTAKDFGGTTEAEDADARREKRRAKRAEDDRIAKEQREEALRYEANRRAKRREVDKAKVKDDRDRRARKDEEAEARRLEDKEDRRAARDARRREEEANRALEDDILKPRSKRRDTEKEDPAASSSRPRTSDRRRSHVDKSTDRPKSSRRKSTMAPVDDYFDSRNGRPVNENDPYGGNDHTTSWVKSQTSEPPEPPPVEPTIMEQAPDFRSKGAADDLMEDEYVRRASHKKSKRSSRMYTDPLGDEQDERRRRRKEREVRSSEGSAAEERYGGLGSMNSRPNDLGGVKLGAGTKTFDGKTGQGKRSSWFQKVTGGF